jgi:hypothetical protein
MQGAGQHGPATLFMDKQTLVSAWITVYLEEFFKDGEDDGTGNDRLLLLMGCCMYCGLAQYTF